MEIIHNLTYTEVVTNGKEVDQIMKKFLCEKELSSILGISRKTVYFWRLQGMPAELQSTGVYRYLYDLNSVKKWMKSMKKEVRN